MLCRFAAHQWFYIYRSCAESSIGTFIIYNLSATTHSFVVTLTACASGTARLLCQRVDVPGRRVPARSLSRARIYTGGCHHVQSPAYHISTCRSGGKKIVFLFRCCLKVSSYMAQYPVPRIAQSTLHFTFMTDHFNQTPSRLLWEASKPFCN